MCRGTCCISLPNDLRERLLAAASINALTELETVIGEMQGLGPGPKCLAGELDRLLLNYAMDEIISLIKQIPAEAE